MKRMLLLLAFVAAPVFAQQSRIASDFEIAQMKEQIARSHDFLAQLSGHLNLGDLYLTRSEGASARSEYQQALAIATAERISARKASDLTRYSTATSYAALAQAKLGDAGDAFALSEEAIRYASGSAKSWNLYASCMNLLGKPRKAVSAARNAVAIASHDARSLDTRLDLAVDQYTLASSLIDAGQPDEAEQLLQRVTDSLRSADFAPLRKEVARQESFEIYSSARGDAAAFLSLLNRAGLRLAALIERRGDIAAARAAYRRVLETRTDDATALAALARLSSGAEQERDFVAAFEANPFSMELIRAYQKYLAAGGAATFDDSTKGGQVRHALADIQRGRTREARATLDALLAQHPQNETLRTLRAETEARAEVPAFVGRPLNVPVAATRAELEQLAALFASDKLTPQQRASLDILSFVGTASFAAGPAVQPGQTIFESGTIEGVPFRFAEPTAFAGSFSAGTPLRLTYRILGATEVAGADALLLEPVKLETPR